MTPQIWMRTLCSGSVRAMLELYVPNAVLVPTYSEEILQGHAELAGYFEEFLDKENFCGRIDEVIEQGPVASGTYTFRWTERGRPQQVQARFTYVFVNTPAGRKILTHHSSEVPEV
jgi:hypothetical protein